MDELQTCDNCNQAKHWRRFRLRVSKGVQKEVTTCSDCRAKASRAETSRAAYYAKKHPPIPAGDLPKRPGYGRITHELDYQLNKHPDETYGDYLRRKESGFPYYYPKLEKQMRSHCNKRTANDRKYLRDHAHEPLSNNAYTAKQQQQGRDRAKGWIAFYDEILNHAITLLRQTGTRPPWAQLEGKGDLHRFHGIYNTKRAAWLRAKG